MFVGDSKLEVSQLQMVEIIYNWLRDEVLKYPVKISVVHYIGSPSSAVFNVTFMPPEVFPPEGENSQCPFVGTNSLELNSASVTKAVYHWLRKDALNNTSPMPTIDSVKGNQATANFQTFTIEMSGRLQGNDV